MDVVNSSPQEEESRPRQAQQGEPGAWPVPLARITTCGGLKLEVLQRARPSGCPGESDPREAVYGPSDTTLLAKKGASTALLLLALLASQPAGFATKDFLSEHLRHVPKDREEEEDREGLKRVDNVVCDLRHLLFPPLPNESAQDRLLRRRLVTFQRASQQSGPGYQLAGLPLVWLDVEAIEAHLKRAKALEQFGEDGLAEWRAAYELASQGSFLPGECYSDWASARREAVEAHLWDCVQVLWRRVVEHGEAGQIEAIGLLRRYWQGHKTCEDALRPLLELLGKRECFGEAETYYQQFCREMEEEGRQPDRRTREVMEFLRALQIQRAPKTRESASSSLVSLSVASSNLPLAGSLETSTLATSALLFSKDQHLQRHPELTAYERSIRAVLHIHQTSNAHYFLQDIDTDLRDLEYLEEQAAGDLLVHIRTLLLMNNLLASKIVKDLSQYPLAYAYANHAVRIAKSLSNQVMIATAKYTRGCIKLEWGWFGLMKQGRFHPDRKKIQEAIQDFQAILLTVLREPGLLHPQLQGSTHLQLSRAQTLLQQIAPQRQEQHPVVLAEQAAEMVGCDPIDDPSTRLMLTGTLSGLHLGGYHLVKAGILTTAALPDQALGELQQLKRLTEQTYGQDETRNLAWSTITTAEALLGLKEYEEAAVKAKDALIVCHHLHSRQNAMMIADIYHRIPAHLQRTSAEVKELGDLLETWYGNEQEG